MKRVALTMCACAALLTPVTAAADPVTLTFDEVPRQSVHGLDVEGLQFGFLVGGVPSADAFYNENGPGGFLTELAVLGGDAAGVLSLRFAALTTAIRFNVVLSTIAQLQPGFTVELFDASLRSLGVVGVATANAPFFTGGTFSYEGAPVGLAVIDFNEAGFPVVGSRRFALDFLTYDAAVPEPATWLLTVTGLAAALLVRSTRRRRSAARVNTADTASSRSRRRSPTRTTRSAASTWRSARGDRIGPASRATQ